MSAHRNCLEMSPGLFGGDASLHVWMSVKAVIKFPTDVVPHLSHFSVALPLTYHIVRDWVKTKHTNRLGEDEVQWKKIMVWVYSEAARATT